MIDFVFENPAKIIFGKKAMDSLAEEILKYGKKVLIVYGGGSIKKYGVFDQVKQQLAKGGLAYTELSGVIPNPVLGKVREGIDVCRKSGIDFILALGGGSVIDTVKGIANGVPYEGDVWDFYAHSVAPKKVLPFGVVLTIPASGSEMSYSSVITNEDGRFKRGFNSLTNVPKFSILNPEFTFTLPPYQTACGCVDIMSHMMERYFTQVDHTDFTDRMIEGGIRTILFNGPIALAHPQDYDARAEIMWTASIAHNTLMQTGRVGDWASHGIEHELSAEYDIAHGAGLAIVTPAWMKYVYRRGVNRFVQFAQRVFDVDFAPGMEEETALEGIYRLEAFFTRIGMPTRLSQAGIDESKLEMLARRANPTREPAMGNFVKLDAKDILAIYKLAL